MYRSRNYIWLLSIFAWTVSDAKAQDRFVSLGAVSGGDLAQICAERSDLSLDGCVSYILGVSDQMSLSRQICISGGSRTLQIVGVVRKYLADHPEYWNRAPVFLVSDPLKKAFPCPARVKKK